MASGKAGRSKSTAPSPWTPDPDAGPGVGAVRGIRDAGSAGKLAIATLTEAAQHRRVRRVVLALLAWLLVSTALVTVAVWRNPAHRAVVGMGWGLILLWIGLGGSLMYGCRDALRARIFGVIPGSLF